MIILPSTKTIIQSTENHLSLWESEVSITLVPELKYLRIFHWPTARQTEWFFIKDLETPKIQRLLIEITPRNQIFGGTCKDFLPTGLSWYENPYKTILGFHYGSYYEQILANQKDIRNWFYQQAAFRFLRGSN